MNSENFSATISVDQALELVFHAITNLRGWWSENIEGETDKLGGEFTLPLPRRPFQVRGTPTSTAVYGT